MPAGSAGPPSSYPLDVPGGPYTLKLDWAAIERAEALGVDLLNGGLGTLTGLSLVLLAMAHDHHPDMTRDQAAGLALRHGAEVGTAIAVLFERYGAPAGEKDAAPGEAKAANG